MSGSRLRTGRGTTKSYRTLSPKDPLAPTYRLDDPQWASIVNWTVEALIQAEESGVTQANLAEMKKSDDPVIRRLLGVQRGYGQFIGLDDAWAARVIEAVGNYGEMFERDLGSGSGDEAAMRSKQPLDARRADVCAAHAVALSLRVGRLSGRVAREGIR